MRIVLVVDHGSTSSRAFGASYAVGDVSPSTGVSGIARSSADRYDRKFGVTRDIVWISNDSLGGFTINGRGFPATSSIVGQEIAVRFMNEGTMMHPWHLHGVPMRVVARDG